MPTCYLEPPFKLPTSRSVSIPFLPTTRSRHPIKKNVLFFTPSLRKESSYHLNPILAPTSTFGTIPIPFSDLASFPPFPSLLSTYTYYTPIPPNSLFATNSFLSQSTQHHCFLPFANLPHLPQIPLQRSLIASHPLSP